MKLADSPVQFCACCHALYTGENKRLYVDFQVYYDGPMVNDIRYANEKPVPVQDLFLCENCLTNAGKLIGLVNDEDMKKENKELGELVDEKNQELTELNEVLTEIQSTNSKLLKKQVKDSQRMPRVVDKEKAGV